MEQSKFIIALQKLPEPYLEQYKAFLRSPYFNTRNDVIRFVDLVLDAKTPLSKEALYKKMYPGKPFDDRRVPDLMYRALKLLERFLEEEQYRTQDWQRKLNLLNIIAVNDLDMIRSVVLAEIETLSREKPLRDSAYFYEEFLYQTEADKMFLSRSKIQDDQSLQKKVDQLDLFYLSAKLRDSCEMMNRKRIVAASYEFHLLDSLMKAIEADMDQYAQYPAIILYYRIMLMLNDPENPGHFFQLKDEVHQNIHLFAQDEQRSLYGYLQNYCIRRVNSGRTEFYAELLDIYRYMMGIGLMDEQNKNLQWDLKNMVSIALRLGEHDWTYRTIQSLKPFLPEETRENAYTYNLANYYYETQDYKRATRLLQSVEFSEVYYNLDSKVMLLKIYFEQEEEEVFYAHANALTAYLTRNKLISKDTATIYGNMTKFARKAFVFKTQPPYQIRRKQKNILALREKILATQQVGNVSWLVREVDRMVEG